MTRSTALLLTMALAAGPALAGWDEGTQAFQAGNFERAASEFSTFLEQSPDSFEAHYMLGLSLKGLAREKESLAHLRKAHDLKPDDLSVKLALGRAYSSTGQHAAADQILSTVDAGALGDAAKRAALHQMRAEARLQTGDKAKALKDLDALRKLRPDDAKVQQLYASTALATGDGASAIAALERAASAPGADEATKRRYAKALLVQAGESRDRSAKKQFYSKAARAASQIAAANPSYENLMLQTSAEIGAGLWDDAVRSGTSAAAKKDGDWLAHYYVGQAHARAERFAEAEAPLRRALELADARDQKKVWSQLGFSYEKQKEFAKALDAYSKAGDRDAIARVRVNQETAAYNERVEEENRQIEAMQREARRLEEELEDLEDGGR